MEFRDFERGSAMQIQLSKPAFLSDLKIEIVEGTQHPGLHSIEVYP